MNEMTNDALAGRYETVAGRRLEDAATGPGSAGFLVVDGEPMTLAELIRAVETEARAAERARIEGAIRSLYGRFEDDPLDCDEESAGEAAWCLTMATVLAAIEPEGEPASA